MKVYSEFVDCLFLRGRCRDCLASFILKGGIFGTNFGWPFRGQNKAILPHVWIPCALCIHFTVTLDKLNLFGESYSHQLKIIPVMNQFLSFSKKCLLVGIPSIAKIHNLFYI